MTGVFGRKRFSLKFPDGSIRRFGCCDPKIDSGRDIAERDGRYFLVQDLCGQDFPRVEPELLPEGTLITSGYYDKEHGEWVALKDFVL